MKKKEFIIILVICVLGIVTYFGFSFYSKLNVKTYGVITYKNQELLTFDVNKDAEYWVEGSYGKLKVEVKDGSWRVTEEECPNHICSSIGWVTVDHYFPIVCLPNEVVVMLKD